MIMHLVTCLEMTCAHVLRTFTRLQELRKGALGRAKNVELPRTDVLGVAQSAAGVHKSH